MTPASNAGSGCTFSENDAFNGVKVFSATMVGERDRLGERVTEWIQRHPQCDVRGVYVTQSSDEAFHCLAITLFYWED
jgi:hypothetical protein